MNRRPIGETRRDRLNQWLVGIGVVIVLSSVITSTALLLQHNSDLHSINAAVQTTKANTQEIKAVEKQVATVIDGLPAADQKLTTFADQLLEVEQWAIKCLSQNVGCSSPPTLTTTGS